MGWRVGGSSFWGWGVVMGHWGLALGVRGGGLGLGRQILGVSRLILGLGVIGFAVRFGGLGGARCCLRVEGLCSCVMCMCAYV